jgi:hypothetical protein
MTLSPLPGNANLRIGVSETKVAQALLFILSVEGSALSREGPVLVQPIHESRHSPTKPAHSPVFSNDFAAATNSCAMLDKLALNYFPFFRVVISRRGCHA